MGRVEEAYLLIDAATEDVKAILDDVAGVALSDFWYVLKENLSSFQRLTVDFINALLGHS